MQKLQELYLRIAAERFHYLKFILEGYDNLAILSSVDMKRGVVVVRYPETSGQELFALLGSIASSLSPLAYRRKPGVTTAAANPQV